MDNHSKKSSKKSKKSRESYLLDHLNKENIPQHVAIIMDGNGRWAKKRHLPRVAGHRAGSEAIRRIVEYCPEIGIKFLTMYTFSTENWKRPKEEVNKLMKLFEETLENELSELHKNGVRIIVLGNLDELPESTRNKFTSAIEKTKNNTTLTVATALNYGGRQEITLASRMLADKVKSGEIEPKEINENLFAKQLYTSELPDPELMIRTSGEYRISNFLLWQIAYSEIYITKKLWPDFKKIDLLEAIYDYQQRERRLGGLEKD